MKNLAPISTNITRAVVVNALQRELSHLTALSKAPCPSKAAYNYRVAYAAGAAAFTARLSERVKVDEQVDALTAAITGAARAVATSTRFAK